MATKTAPWNSAELLRDNEDIVAYLDAALDEVSETGDTGAFTRALGVVAKSHGMSSLAQEIGLGRESLYKALSPTGNPELGTVVKVLRGLGIRLEAHDTKERELQVA
jgi:probable addiction module antidote protein